MVTDVFLFVIPGIASLAQHGVVGKSRVSKRSGKLFLFARRSDRTGIGRHV